MNQIDLQSTAYHIQQIVKLEGKLEMKKLKKTFKELIKRHESLRISFEVAAGESVQKVQQQVEFEIEYYDLQITSAGDRWETSPRGTDTSLIIDQFIRSFDLARAPLLRAGVIQMETNKYILMVDMHHIITDGVSGYILIRDFAALYGGKSLSSLRLQYKDFSQWQNSAPVKKSIAHQKAYWTNRFAGNIPQLRIDTDYKRADTKTFAGESIDFLIKQELNQRLKDLSKETGTTVFMILLAVYNVLLSRYSGQEDIVVGSPITGRKHADLQNIVGMFVNMLAFRNHPAGNKTFSAFLQEVRQNALQAYENQDYQFEQLIADLELQRHANRNPLFDVVFAMQNIDIGKDNSGEFEGVKHLKITAYQFNKKTTPFDLLISAFDAGNVIGMNLTYSTQLFESSTAGKITRHFIEVLEQVVEDKHIKLQNIRLSHQLVALKSDGLLEEQGDFGF